VGRKKKAVSQCPHVEYTKLLPGSISTRLLAVRSTDEVDFLAIQRLTGRLAGIGVKREVASIRIGHRDRRRRQG
jgi:hypothetical protein